MKRFRTFQTDVQAYETQQRLQARGIKARMVVDPLESRAPALSSFSGVALIVREEEVHDAESALDHGLKRVG